MEVARGLGHVLLGAVLPRHGVGVRVDLRVEGVASLKLGLAPGVGHCGNSVGVHEEDQIGVVGSIAGVVCFHRGDLILDARLALAENYNPQGVVRDFLGNCLNPLGVPVWVLFLTELQIG